MRIAVTGGTGLLGRALLEVFAKEHPDWDVTVLSRRTPPKGLDCDWTHLDVSDLGATVKAITDLNSSVVIHAAALGHPDACANHPEEAWKVNFLGTRNVALACDHSDIDLFFISSDQVFYGAGKRVVEEYDTPKATNLYGRTKILGEEFIKQHLKRWWIVRTAKLFGGPGDTRSFVITAHNTLSAKQSLRVAKDWAAHNTHAVYFAQAIVRLIQRRTYGIYHAVSPGVPSYAEIAEFIAKTIGVPLSLLIPVTQKELGLSASRTSYLELATNLWRLDFGEDLPSWKDGVRKFLQEGTSRRTESPLQE
jgi:dTDP-4-dehydrorhamnose reductase